MARIDIINDFSKYLSKRYKKATVNKYLYAANRFILFLQINKITDIKKINLINKKIIEDFVDSVKKDNGSNYTEVSKRDLAYSLKPFLLYLYPRRKKTIDKTILEVVTENINKTNIKKHTVDFLTNKEVNYIIGELNKSLKNTYSKKKARNFLLFKLSIFTGMSIVELHRLKYGDIVYDQNKECYIVSIKRIKEHEICIDKDIIDIEYSLLEDLFTQKDKYIASVKVGTLTRIMDNIIHQFIRDKLGIYATSFTIRKTFIRIMIEKGYSIMEIASLTEQMTQSGVTKIRKIKKELGI